MVFSRLNFPIVDLLQQSKRTLTVDNNVSLVLGINYFSNIFEKSLFRFLKITENIFYSGSILKLLFNFSPLLKESKFCDLTFESTLHFGEFVLQDGAMCLLYGVVSMPGMEATFFCLFFQIK